ncbi:MAG: MlaD family protein [Planctomycetota bacterium]|nr:MlaD family protein [Planctomycetota bacterium]
MRRGLSGLLWLVPLAAVGLSIGFAVRALQERGPTVLIRAEHGHGIGRGDAVRYLGAQVGEVRGVAVEEGAEGDGVRIEVVMRRDAASLARAGTLFWIVRPQLSLDSVSGLETIIGAQYVALHPGPDEGPPRTEFTALGAAPLADELRESQGLEIVLEAPMRYGLQPGAAVAYRGVRIGSVISVGLASDASSVEIRARIRRAYTQLVRERSVFWETGGVELGLSITSGLQLDLDSLRTALIGGISMATPIDGGAAATEGTRFVLAPDAEDEWRAWAPALPVGNDLLPSGSTLPRLARATLSWWEGRVVRTRRERSGWMLVTDDGLVGPSNLLAVPSGAREGAARLAVAGATLELGNLDAAGRSSDLGSGLRQLPAASLGEAWARLRQEGDGAARARRRVLLEPEDLVLVRDGARAPLAIASSRLSLQGDGMAVDPSIPITADWHGAAVMARGDGALAGLLIVSEEGSRVVPAP